MSKLYWRLFIALLSMLTCMPIKYVQAPPKQKNSSRNEETAEQEITDNLNFLSEAYSQPDAISTWTTENIIRHYRYPFESHKVTTMDGYILELHRIPPKTKNFSRNYPVLIPHCVGGSSADWVLAGPRSSLAMQLNDAGYDVWLANNRGNTYSRKHTNETLTTDNPKFWNFTLHELGTLDLPAIIDYVLRITTKEQLHYIGYSMSTCIFYILATRKLEYQRKFRSQISMAPVSRLGNSTSAVAILTSFNRILDNLVQSAANGEFNSNESYMRKILQKYCNKEKLEDQKLCLKFIIFAICGTNKKTFNTDILSNIVGHYPSSTSSKVVAHLAQFIKRDKFAEFSHGSWSNWIKYGSPEPPLYRLEDIYVPITLMYGKNDKLVQPTDASRLREILPNVMDFIEVDDDNFNHVDFLWNRNVKVKINDLVVATFNETDKSNWRYMRNNPAIVKKSTQASYSAGALAPVPSMQRTQSWPQAQPQVQPQSRAPLQNWAQSSSRAQTPQSAPRLPLASSQNWAQSSSWTPTPLSAPRPPQTVRPRWPIVPEALPPPPEKNTRRYT